MTWARPECCRSAGRYTLGLVPHGEGATLNSVHNAHQIGEPATEFGTRLIQKSRKKAYFKGFFGGTSPAGDSSVKTHLESKTMKKTLIAVALAGLASVNSTAVIAADPKAPTPDFEISGNFGLFSDYRFRGISQTDRKAALQGGFDLTHKSGFYIGNWNSNVHNFWYPGASMESDIYGGFKREIGPVEANVGVLRYIYPGNTGNPSNTNTTEAYLSLSYGPISYKFSRSDGNYFGAANTKGTTYNELNLAYDLTEKISVSVHAGKTNIAKTSSGDFSDYKIGVAYGLPDDYSLGLSYYNNSGLDAAEKLSNTSSSGKQLYKSGAVISLSKTF